MNEDEAVGRTLALYHTPEFQAYMTALFNDWVWWHRRQLTTGPMWLRGFRSTQPTQPDPLPPCTCFYGLLDVHGAPGPWIPVRRPGIRRLDHYTAAFRIDPGCPHHGDRLEVWDHEPQYWDTLTDDSERGNDADQT